MGDDVCTELAAIGLERSLSGTLSLGSCWTRDAIYSTDDNIDIAVCSLTRGDGSYTKHLVWVEPEELEATINFLKVYRGSE